MRTSDHQAEPAPRQDSVPGYVLTGGRTQPCHTLRLESLLGLGPAPTAAVGTTEDVVLALCREQPRSVAELAGVLRVSTQIMKIILSDLIESNALSLIVPVGAEETGPEGKLQILEATLAGLRRRYPHAG